MRLRWNGFRKAPLPEVAARAIAAAGDGDRTLAWTADEQSGEFVVAGEHALYAVSPDGALRWARAWHFVDGGAWDRDSATLRVTWVDGATPEQWRLPLDTDFPVVFRARVQASVVLSDVVEVGPRRTVKAVIRKDLRDQSLLAQVVPGRGVELTDPAVRAISDEALVRLKEQVGLE